MQSVSSRIWTRVAVSISYDDNHYTTGTSYLNQSDLLKTIYIQLLYLMSYNSKFFCVKFSYLKL